MEEDLLACSPDEILSAVNAPDGAILVLTFLCSFHYLSGFRVCHVLLPLGSVNLKIIMPAGDKAIMYERVRSSVLTKEGKVPACRAAIGQLVYNYVENVSR